MNFLNKVKTIFSGGTKEEESASNVPSVPASLEENKVENIKDESKQEETVSSVSAVENEGAIIEPPSREEHQETPVLRKVIQAPAIESNVFPESPDVLIKAQPSPSGDQCLFRVNRDLLKGHSWYFSGFESAAGSPLAEGLFGLGDVETVLVHESTFTLTREDKTLVDWKPLAIEVGKKVREILNEGGALLSEKILAEMPSEEEIRSGIQNAIDVEVNPGVAGHGGNITLLSVKGNTVTVQMGGGCQGCSAADLTLKQGIHTTFRKFVPQVGAIYDETDHAAGLNPFFQGELNA